MSNFKILSSFYVPGPHNPKDVKFQNFEYVFLFRDPNIVIKSTIRYGLG
jgi:hypothetical protein